METRHPEKKFTIIGGGIVGVMEAYFYYLYAKENGLLPIRITIYEKSKSLSDTTTAHLAPSLTPSEILAVVPPREELLEKLNILFTYSGGLYVDDVEGVNNSAIATRFIEHVRQFSLDEETRSSRIRDLLELGKMSMNLWQYIYDSADPDLKNILDASNFNPCREPYVTSNRVLHDGYRIDLIYCNSNAADKAQAMKLTYESLGYRYSKILSPKEVIEIAPYLKNFCISHSITNTQGHLEWKNDVVALWRPGGCIDTHTFLPKFYEYLKKTMGQYKNERGEMKDCFQFKLNSEVVGVTYKDSTEKIINGLKISGKSEIKSNRYPYKDSNYVFCPGESITTLERLGFKRPPCAGFAGPSLILNFSIPKEKSASDIKFNYYMGVILGCYGFAIQAKEIEGNKVLIAIAGGKAFYGDKKPSKHEKFAKTLNLLQFNLLNEIFPELISFALGRDTKGKNLEMTDLIKLENENIAERWVGLRAVTADGWPTLGDAHNGKGKVKNGRLTADLSSGGVSFAPGAVYVSQSLWHKTNQPNLLAEKILTYADSRRGYNNHFAKL